MDFTGHLREGYRRCVAGVAILTLSFLTLELLVRSVRWVSGTVFDYPLLRYPDLELFEGRPYNRWALRPGVVFRSRDETVHVNSLGYRGPEIERPKPLNRIRILALGGSTVFGYGMKHDEDSWPGALQAILKSRCADQEVEVINGGVPGYSTADALTRLALGATEIQPDFAILYESLNDSMNNVPEPGKTFRQDYSHRYSSYAFPIWGHSLLLYVAEVKVSRFFPNRVTASTFSQEGIDVYRRNVKLFVAIARDLAIEPILATQAHDFEHRRGAFLNQAPGLTARILQAQEDALREVGAATGAIMVDVHAALKTRDPKELFLDDAHLTQAGNALAAEVIADAIADRVSSLRSP